MSLNSPHLGYNENAYAHVNFGMYFLKLSKKYKFKTTQLN